MTCKPCIHCQRLWSAQSLVTVGAAELCPICYKQRRWVRVWPCKDCTAETGRTLTCHDHCARYRGYVQMLQAAKPSQSERDAAEVTFRGQCKSMKQRGTRKPTLR